jgi:hypothetical protein
MAILKGDLEIATFLQIGIATLRRHSSVIPHQRVGNIRITSTEALENWLGTSKGVRELINDAGLTGDVHKKYKKQKRKVGRPARPAISDNSHGGNE